MKKLLLLFCLLMSFSTMFAGVFQRILASDTDTPTPAGCYKVVFHQYNQCSKLPYAVVEDALGNHYTLESCGYG